MTLEKCDHCHAYHAPSETGCSPVRAMQPWGVDELSGRVVDVERRVGRCDTCGDPTTGFTAEGQTRCPACQRKGER